MRIACCLKAFAAVAASPLALSGVLAAAPPAAAECSYRNGSMLCTEAPQPGPAATLVTTVYPSHLGPGRTA